MLVRFELDQPLGPVLKVAWMYISTAAYSILIWTSDCTSRPGSISDAEQATRDHGAWHPKDGEQGGQAQGYAAKKQEGPEEGGVRHIAALILKSCLHRRS